MNQKLKLYKFKILVAVLGILIFAGAVFGAYKLGQRSIYPEPVEGPTPTPTETARVGLWKDCDPKINNCEIGLKCIHYYDDVYRCIKYLKEGEECGRSMAEPCGESLACVDTNETRTVCGTFSTKGEKECFVEPLQICKSLGEKVYCEEPRPQACTMECIQNPPYICGSDGNSYCSTCQACATPEVEWYVIQDKPCGSK